MTLVAEWTYPGMLKPSHFEYLGWAKMALKWLKRVLCDTRLTKLTLLRVYVTTGDGGKRVISGLNGCHHRVGHVQKHTLTEFQPDRRILIFHAASE